jgi:hypothetical protein
MEGSRCRRKHVGTLALTALSEKEPRGVEAHKVVLHVVVLHLATHNVD